MPVLADTIVECGRRTLTNAINLANAWGRDPDNKWHGCEVLYGDTDSVFIKLPGRSVDEAFDFGDQFCRTVTAQNPPPVQLKLEKVYLGCILQTVRCFRAGSIALFTWSPSNNFCFQEKKVLWHEI